MSMSLGYAAQGSITDRFRRQAARDREAVSSKDCRQMHACLSPSAAHSFSHPTELCMCIPPAQSLM